MSSYISPLNIVILPDEKVQQKALELSRKVSEKFETYFTLDNKKYFPHITVYQTHYPHKNVLALKEKLFKFAKNIKPFKVSASEITSIFNSWISWNLFKTKELTDLELQVLELANPLREGLISEGLKEIAQSEQDSEEIENYGALLLKDRYTPHITITRIKDSDKVKEAVELIHEMNEYEFLVDKLYLGNLGEHGTVNKIVDEFPFG